VIELGILIANIAVSRSQTMPIPAMGSPADRWTFLPVIRLTNKSRNRQVSDIDLKLGGTFPHLSPDLVPIRGKYGTNFYFWYAPTLSHSNIKTMAAPAAIPSITPFSRLGFLDLSLNPD
jgi:hypothetical protein